MRRKGRLELKRIEDKLSRQVSFSKRKTGLLKKAREISVLCDADVALIIFSSLGKLSQFSHPSSMERILERHENHGCLDNQNDVAQNPDLGITTTSSQQEKLAARLEVLQRNAKHYVGEELNPLSFSELHCLEQQLELALRRIRTRKDKLMHDAICQLQRKEKALQQQNNNISDKLNEEAAAEVAITEPHPSPQLIPFLTIGESSSDKSLPQYEGIPCWMLPHANN